MKNHVPTSSEEWREHWQEKGVLWRTEPEIDANRRGELRKCCTIVPDIEKGMYPFKGMKLSRADIEWLLATHENGRGPVDWSDEKQRDREGLDLRGADLCYADLSGLPLAKLDGGLSEWDFPSEEESQMAVMFMDGINLSGAHLEGAELGGAHLEKANLREAHLERANLYQAHLERADLYQAHLERANLSYACLERAELGESQLNGAKLVWTQLKDARLLGAKLERADLRVAQLVGTNLCATQLKGANLGEAYLEKTALNDAQLEGANLRMAHLERVDLRDVTLSNKQHVGPQLADILWINTNLTVVDWSQMKILGDENKALQKTSDGKKKEKEERLFEHQEAVRANRQLTNVLQDQGLNEDANRFAYRAEVLQRKIFWRQRRYGKWLGSAILALLAGYGYRMWHILVAYCLIVLLCAGAYFILGMYYLPHLSFLEAVLTSITAFHGRVFSEPFLHSDEPQLWVTAFEAVAGLIIEGVFIAMLTQKFFGK